MAMLCRHQVRLRLALSSDGPGRPRPPGWLARELMGMAGEQLQDEGGDRLLFGDDLAGSVERAFADPRR
jgi:hypothetical protein